MKQKFSSILLILVFICCIKTSFSISSAFIGEDLGLNLYKNIDSGIGEMETAQYSYEMKGQKSSGKIEDELNTILKKKGFGDCLFFKPVSEEDITEISNGNIGTLSEKLSPLCGNKISTLNAIQEYVKTFKENTANKARKKSKHIYNISRIGLYADGNLKNSPFDIIQDIKDIDYIVFTQEIEYEGETPIDDKGLSDYLNEKFTETQNSLNNESNNEISTIENNALNEASSAAENNEPDQEISSITPIEGSAFGNDQTQYMCPQDGNSSGLSPETIDNLLLNNIGQQTASNPSTSGGGTNEEDSGGEQTNYAEDIDKEVALLNTNYENISDDNVWKCKNFFCITIEFIIHKHSLFGSEKMRSIQSIVETSNEHLKKFANASLIQSKMTTNNFELGLRDGVLSDIFSFGMIISKKSPPILELEGSYQDEDAMRDNNPLSAKSLTCRRLEASSLNCRRENDLAIFLDTDAESKTIVDSAELSPADAARKNRARKVFQQQQKLMDDFIAKAIQKDSQLKETDELYTEFLELERFVGNIKDYSFDLNALVKNMIEIPIHP